MLARELGALYRNRGEVPRCRFAISKNTQTTDSAAVAPPWNSRGIRIEGDCSCGDFERAGRVGEIRSEQVGHTASLISVIPEVRRTLVSRQREMGAQGGVVLDGRDISTVVFPEANIKFYLTAVPEERAARRYEENRLKQRDVTFEETLADINTRDQRDSTRADSPLAIADDAIVIDSTELSIEEVFERMAQAVRERTTCD